MLAAAQEWLNLVVRWIHVVAAIMWIGDSFLFMWLDSHLGKPGPHRGGAVVGELWMTHSGGFYEVIKRKALSRSELPPTLHWFKWESYTTWLSGVLLLIIVFHLNGAALLIDGQVLALEPWQAITLSLGLLPLAFGLYELLWKSPLATHPRLFAGVGWMLIVGLAYGLTHVFSARGAFLQVGATLGSVMAANVFFRIIPAQKHMLAATRAGTEVDTRYGARAKGRSIQNHYLTLPVLFTMLSSHFPTTYGNRFPWLVLGLLVLFGAGLKLLMNLRENSPPLVLLGTVGAFTGAVVLAWPVSPLEDDKGSAPGAALVSYATVRTVLDTRCITCHSAQPSNPLFPSAPLGVKLDTAEALRTHVERVYVRAVATRTMPPGNITGMTTAERELVGTWFKQGADIHAPGPSALAPPEPPPTDAVEATAAPAGAEGPPNEAAARVFEAKCALCHGAQGHGDGPASVALTPKPRSFTDAAWQQHVSDDQLRLTVLGGGAVRGLSPLMPAFPELREQPAVLEALVHRIRAFAPPSP